MGRHTARRGDPLTAREADVLCALAHGGTNTDIGRALGISPHTVKHHISHILTKLGARNRTTAAAIAHRARLVS